MRGIYLGACKARHPNHDIVYQDIDLRWKCDLDGDMLVVPLNGYDYIIATPPCNFWSKANPYYLKSSYSLKTKHLLPDILIRLSMNGKPFLVENVKNYSRMRKFGVFDICEKHNIFVYAVGRHLYFTNLSFIDLNCPQQQDFIYGGKRINNDGYNQGGKNVHDVVEIWLSYIEKSGTTLVPRPEGVPRGCGG